MLISHVPHNDVSVNDGPHIQRWSRNIIILKYNIIILTIVLQLPTVFSTVQVCSLAAIGYTIQTKCVVDYTVLSRFV